MGVLRAVYQIAFASETDGTFDNWINFWTFMQLNVGIIAACCPSLKPLVNKVLKLSEYGTGALSRTYQYGHSGGLAGSNAYGRGGHTSRIKSMVSARSRSDGAYELDDRYPMPDDDVFKGSSVTATATTFYKEAGEGPDRSGSEDMILGAPRQGVPSKGIMKTTEVTVN